MKGYTHLKILGLGGNADVSLVVGPSGELRALKTMFIDEGNAFFRKYVQNELYVMRRIPAEAQFVTHLLDASVEPDRVQLLLPYAAGGTLGELLCCAWALSEQSARFYFCEVFRALRALHAAGVTHCDIKSDNVLLDEHGHIMLCDFGEGFADISLDGYDEPYAFAYSRAEDAAGIGLLLYHCVTGRLFPRDPLTGDPEHPVRLARRHAESGGSAPWKGLSPACRDLLTGLWKEDKGERVKFFDNLVSHDWMEGLCWRRVQAGKNRPPQVRLHQEKRMPVLESCAMQ